MFTLKDLEAYFGKTMRVNDIEFTLTKVEELSGELAVWVSEDYIIRATPLFDNVPVPVEVLQKDLKVLDDEWCSIGTDAYTAEIDNFERYSKVVKVLSEKILRKM